MSVFVKYSEEFAQRVRYQRDHRGVDPELLEEIWSIGSDSLLREVEQASTDQIATLNTAWRERADG